MITVNCECGKILEIGKCFIDNFGNIDVDVARCRYCCESAVDDYIREIDDHK